MTAIVIACVGSPFGADNLGHMVAEILRNHRILKSLPENLLRIESSDRPQLNLLNQIQGVDLAIIVDAVRDSLSPGQILRISADQLIEEDDQLSSHAIGVAEALALGQTLDLLPPRLLIMGLSVGQSQNWEPGSEDLTKLADTIVDEVVRFVSTLGNVQSPKPAV